MRDAQPTTIYLKDYTPPDFLIDSVDLKIELDEEKTRVISQLRIRRNPDAVNREGPLILAGEAMILEQVKLAGRDLTSSEYSLNEENLSIADIPAEAFTLEIHTLTNPKTNTSLEGLYLSKGMFCTQCEAEGFRKITYFLDRPDVMSRFTTTLVADRGKYPMLLSNGNPVKSGELDGGRHWVTWEDPFKKPCYLFAVVAGDLCCIEDFHTTPSGRKITLQIFVEQADSDKCGHAMQALKKSMLWDEQVYGREYDLDLYMIVAVSHFNMGAMENKGLNIFNTKFVLARPDTATDFDFEHVEGVIAHEYFHNWTGNRITCRDWFQLSLKEGFTVFRDQEFTADHSSRGVKRINDVNLLRSRQFAEDAGPLAHPIRPDSYMEINNFYTLTVYEKGAEVVRMIHTLLGAEGFRKGSDLYFERHDGQAVTTDDFVRAMEDANGFDLTLFRRWYSQAGTPVVTIESQYNPEQQQLILFCKQQTPATAGQKEKQPLHIPLAVALFDQSGAKLAADVEGEVSISAEQVVLHLTDAEQQFVFNQVPEKPAISVLRGFSAPVKLVFERNDEELALLLRCDDDSFSRWEAGQILATRVIFELIGAIQQGQQQPGEIPPHFLDAFQSVLNQDFDDLAFKALLLSMPSESYLSEQMAIVDPDAIHKARNHLMTVLARQFEGKLLETYQRFHMPDKNEPTAISSGQRAIKNTALQYLSLLQSEQVYALIANQYTTAGNMTDQFAGLTELVNSDHPETTHYLEKFYQQWEAEALVIDKWFSLQAGNSRSGSVDAVIALMAHPAFDLKTPNRVRALVGAFSQANPVHFHELDGRGYQFLADRVIELNSLNPQVASRMLGALTHWARYDEKRQQLMKAQLTRIIETPGISKDVYEIASKSLG